MTERRGPVQGCDVKRSNKVAPKWAEECRDTINDPIPRFRCIAKRMAYMEVGRVMPLRDATLEVFRKYMPMSHHVADYLYQLKEDQLKEDPDSEVTAESVMSRYRRPFRR